MPLKTKVLILLSWIVFLSLACGWIFGYEAGHRGGVEAESSRWEVLANSPVRGILCQELGYIKDGDEN